MVAAVTPRDQSPRSWPWPQVIGAVVRHGAATRRGLRSRDRSRRITLVRHVTMYLGRKLTTLTLVEIGRHLGDRDHTTVRHGVDRITKLLKQNDPETSSLVLCIGLLIEQDDPDDRPRPELVVDDDGEANPVLRVTYRRLDGTRWRVSLAMEPVE